MTRTLGDQHDMRAAEAGRLGTIAGFYKYAVEEELLEHPPAATGLDRDEVGALLVAAGLGTAPSMP